MQQDEVLSELLEYAKIDPPPQDSLEVLATEGYLRALNNIYAPWKETCIFQPGGTGMQRLDKGFSYFQEWAQELVDSGAFESGVDRKLFITWQVCVNHVVHIAMNSDLQACVHIMQTWDLLRIMVYGFRGLVMDFLTSTPAVSMAVAWRCSLASSSTQPVAI